MIDFCNDHNLPSRTKKRYAIKFRKIKSVQREHMVPKLAYINWLSEEIFHKINLKLLSSKLSNYGSQQDLTDAFRNHDLNTEDLCQANNPPSMNKQSELFKIFRGLATSLLRHRNLKKTFSCFEFKIVIETFVKDSLS